MNHVHETNGNVTFVTEPGDAEMLEQLISQYDNEHSFLFGMLDYFGYIGNAGFRQINPEDVGALTDAPMFTNDLEYEEDGSKKVLGTVWWYPGYEGSSFAQSLLEKGRVTFTNAGPTIH